MGGPGSGRKPGGGSGMYKHPVTITKINGIIKKTGASHHTQKAASRAKLHGRTTHNFGIKPLQKTLGIKTSNIAYRMTPDGG
jgi:hypothetical protein